MLEEGVAVTATRMNRRWRRNLAVLTAGVAAVAAGVVSVPVLTAGASTAINPITTNTGIKPSVGNPQPKATAKVAVTASAVDPTTGDVVEMAGNQVFLLVNEANEPATDYGIGVSGTLVQGDVYLIAGRGSPGWTPQTDNATTAATPVPAATTVIGLPQAVAFDAAGNLLIGSTVTGQSNVIAVPRATGPAYGFGTLQAGYSYFIAGYTATTHLAAPAINLSGPATFVSLTATGGLETGSVQDVAFGTANEVEVLNFGSTTKSFYGTSVAADHAGGVAGSGVAAGDGAGTCSTGAQNLGALVFPVTGAELVADGNGNLYVANQGLTDCVWVLPKTTGSLVIDGSSTGVTAGQAYKIAGNGISPRATAPTSGASAVSAPVGTAHGITIDPAGNPVILINGGSQSKTTINGAWVVANSHGKYYGQTMTPGDLYPVVGGPAHLLQVLQSPNTIGTDPAGDLYFVDSQTNTLYQETGGPTGPSTTVATTTVLTTTAAQARTGTPVTLKATVTPSTAAGTVQFFHGVTSLGTKPVTSGKATLVVNTSTTPLTPGTYSFTAVFTPTNPNAFTSSTSSPATLKVLAAAGGGTTPTTTIVPSTSGSESVTQTLPAEGKFKLTVVNGATVTMGKPTRTGNNETSTGALVPVTVTDTRNTVPGWTVSGQVSAFTGSGRAAGDTIPAKDLGWVPSITSQTTGQDATAGSAVTAGTASGLGAKSTWANAVPGVGLGKALLAAGLTLTVPYTTAVGVYTATFTVTAI